MVAHFHEWMAATAIPEIRRENLDVRLVFTTHATMLGRYLAMNDPWFYEHLPFFDWKKEAKYFNIEPTIAIERAAAHGCHVFTTVSEVTALECKYLLGREPDQVLPNGLNIERFSVMHEVHLLHQKYKEKIQEFIMGHFFQSYSFDLDKTLFFFTSGRYEYSNKGFDLTLEALARLNHRLKEEKSDVTIVMFFITKAPYSSINPEVLQSRAVMEEIRHTCEAIEKQIGERLFRQAAISDDNRLPDVKSLVDEYWKLRYRRTLQSWRTSKLPSVVTHNLYDDHKDDILNFVRNAGLINKKEDKVKVVYHPDFINPSNPLFPMEYGQFVRGCHLGIFPSNYEPWGYTPLECIARGVPAITSDLSGFGDYVLKKIKQPQERGTYVVRRSDCDFNSSADQLTEFMAEFISKNRRHRLSFRNEVENSSEHFDWKNLRKYYDKAYREVLKRVK